MTIQQYGDGTELVWLPDLSQLITTTDELAADDEISFAIAFDLVSGSVCWGHDTGVTEDNTRNFFGNWTGDGIIINQGVNDTEAIELESGQYMESEIVNVGVHTLVIESDQYVGSGGAVVKYKDGSDEEACEADSWNLYSNPFSSAGYTKIRLEHP